MRDVAIPSFVKRGIKRINVWCAASSTGQECYSMAMMLEEAIALYKDVSYTILGSDINLEVLETAKTGVYPIAELENIPSRFQMRYCHEKNDECFEILPSLKDKIIWRQINLVRSLSFMSSYHIIFCRNVMIYFEPDTKEALTSELFRLVTDGGYVYVGSTETLDIKRTRFKYIQPSVFAKRAV